MATFVKIENTSENYYVPTVQPDSNGDIPVISNEAVNFILDKTYPVGAIYLSATDINPGDMFGGTWQKIEDKFLIGKSTTYSKGGGQ